MDSNLETVEETVASLLEPHHVTPQLVSRALKRARRHGLYWSLLKPLERALLEAAARARVAEYKSPTLKRILARLIALIEANTPTGLVILKGLKYALSRGLLALAQAKNKLNYIKYLGRSLLTVENYFTPLLKS